MGRANVSPFKHALTVLQTALGVADLANQILDARNGRFTPRHRKLVSCEPHVLFFNFNVGKGCVRFRNPGLKGQFLTSEFCIAVDRKCAPRDHG